MSSTGVRMQVRRFQRRTRRILGEVLIVQV